MYQIVRSYPYLVDDLNEIYHKDYHQAEFELMMHYYFDMQEKYALHLGNLGSYEGYYENLKKYFESQFSEDFETTFEENYDSYMLFAEMFFQDNLDDIFQIKNLKKMEYFMEEFDSVMHFDYTNLIETQELDN
jgi:hypothetical protein